MAVLGPFAFPYAGQVLPVPCQFQDPSLTKADMGCGSLEDDVRAAKISSINLSRLCVMELPAAPISRQLQSVSALSEYVRVGTFIGATLLNEPFCRTLGWLAEKTNKTHFVLLGSVCNVDGKLTIAQLYRDPVRLSDWCYQFTPVSSVNDWPALLLAE